MLNDIVNKQIIKLQPTILSIHYLPCVLWFRHFLNDEHVLLEQHENYEKQSYRNRCVILSANGPLALTIPVKKTQHKIPMHEVEIENDFNWQKQHWEAICSAYRSSPYFEHYEHHFENFYKKKFNFLQDFNIELIKVCLKILKIDKEIILSDSYYISLADCADFRRIISPKIKSDETFNPYLQVFAAKFPFIENLSVLDLIFNQGPNSIEKCIIY